MGNGSFIVKATVEHTRSGGKNNMEHTIQELHELQALPLSDKIEMTKERIKAWVDHFGEDHVCISFSGGKDSTVLLDIARQEYPDLKAVFIDVPTQYPELKSFATSFSNVDVVKPKVNFMQVCEKYGFPFISKEVAECVQGARKYLTSVLRSQESLQTDRQTDRQTDASICVGVCGHSRDRSKNESRKKELRTSETGEYP